MDFREFTKISKFSIFRILNLKIFGESEEEFTKMLINLLSSLKLTSLLKIVTGGINISILQAFTFVKKWWNHQKNFENMLPTPY